MHTTSPDDDVLRSDEPRCNVTETARLIGASNTTVGRLWRRGQLRAFRGSGGTLYFRRSEVDGFVARQANATLPLAVA